MTTAPEQPLTAPPAEWTFMLYTGTIDNDFSFSQHELLTLLGKIEASPRVHFVYELSKPEKTERGRVRFVKDAPPQIEVLAEGPRINTSSPKRIAAFIDWATRTFPSRYTALVFKDHGGPNDPPRKVEPLVEKNQTERKWLVPTPAVKIIALEILDDGETDDYLSDRGLRTTLEKTRLGHVDLYGFDACSMSMTEIAYEIRNVASYMVATEESLLQLGWPYRETVEVMNSSEHLGPRTLAKKLATKNRDLHLIAADLSWMHALASKLDVLGGQLNDLLPANQAIVEQLRSGAVAMGPNCDLESLLLTISAKAPDLKLAGLKAAADAALDVLKRVSFDGDPPAPRTGGLSIYFPPESGSPYLVTYGALEFARSNRWASFIANWCSQDAG